MEMWCYFLSLWHCFVYFWTFLCINKDGEKQKLHSQPSSPDEERSEENNLRNVLATDRDRETPQYREENQLWGGWGGHYSLKTLWVPHVSARNNNLRFWKDRAHEKKKGGWRLEKVNWSQESTFLLSLQSSRIISVDLPCVNSSNCCCWCQCDGMGSWPQ